MVLELARPAEAWCFPSGRWFFRSWSCLQQVGSLGMVNNTRWRMMMGLAESTLSVPWLFFRGRRQGRQPLNPAMPRRVVREAKHSFSYPGARPCRRPSLKSFSLLGFSRFWGFGVGKKSVKFEDAFWRFLLGVFWSIFGHFSCFFGTVHA